RINRRHAQLLWRDRLDQPRRQLIQVQFARAQLKRGNPAADVGAAFIASFIPKDRALSSLEIRLMHRQLDQVATYPTTRLASRLPGSPVRTTSIRHRAHPTARPD